MRITTLLMGAALATAMGAVALAQPPGGGGGRGGGFGGAQLTPEQLQAAFKAGDADNSGSLTKAELPAALTARQAAQQAAMAAAASAAGVTLPAGAGGGAGRGGGALTPEQIDAQFTRMDTNSDGSISLAEFSAAPAGGRGGGGGRGGPGGPGGPGGGRGPGGGGQ